MSFLAAIPLIGKFFDSVGDAIDKNVTTDEERLQLKAAINQTTMPLLTTIVQAQMSYHELQGKIAVAEAQSEHWLQWARRPIICLIAAVNFIVALWLSQFDWIFISDEFVQRSFYFAMAANGLDMGTRGVEKIAKTLKSKEKI